MNHFALITGASQGIGRSFAFEMAKRNASVILVALPTPELETTAEELRKQYTQIQVHTIGIDLTKDEAPEQIYAYCQEHQLTVKYLINNAGMGYTGAFEQQPLAFFDTLMKLNMLATTKLVRLFVNDMKTLPQAYILNVASMAGLYDMPFKTVYSASKAYVYTFSRALREELLDTSVSVTVLCPGGVATNPEILASVEKIGKAAKMLTAMPDEVAQVGVKAMLKKKAMQVPKLTSRIYASFRHIIPYRIQLKMISRFLRKKYR